MPPPTAQACKDCGHRYAQDRTGLCRTCLKAAGRFYGVLEVERLRLEAARAADQRRRVPREELQPRPPIVKVIGGVEFEVTWDGS